MSLTVLLGVCLLGGHCVMSATMQDLNQVVEVSAEPLPAETPCYSLTCTVLCIQRMAIPVCRPEDTACLCQNTATEPVKPEEQPKTPFFSHFFAIFHPLNAVDSAQKGYIKERVNVQDGPMVNSFVLLLTGLFILILVLVAYEMYICCKGNEGEEQEVNVEKQNSFNYGRFK